MRRKTKIHWVRSQPWKYHHLTQASPVLSADSGKARKATTPRLLQRVTSEEKDVKQPPIWLRFVVPTDGHDGNDDARFTTPLCADTSGYWTGLVNTFRPKGPKRTGSEPSRVTSLGHVLSAPVPVHPCKTRRAGMSVHPS